MRYVRSVAVNTLETVSGVAVNRPVTSAAVRSMRSVAVKLLRDRERRSDEQVG